MKPIIWIPAVLIFLLVAFGFKTYRLEKQPPVVYHSRQKDNVPNRNPASKKPDTKSTALKSSELENDLREIQKTQDCYTNHTCPFDQKDPRAYDIAVGEKLAAQIRDIHKKYKTDSKSLQQLKKVALENFRSENGFVQEAALEILKEFPIDEEVLLAISEGLRDSYNPLIIELSLPELEKYLGTPQEDQVHSTLSDIMRGAHFASQKVAENIQRFINSHSYEHYRTLLSRMQPQSQAYRNLQSALKEYERQNTGG